MTIPEKNREPNPSCLKKKIFDKQKLNTHDIKTT